MTTDDNLQIVTPTSTLLPSQSSSEIFRISIFNALTKGLLHAMLFFIGIHLKSIGFTGTQIGITFMIYSLTGLLSILPSGFSNDIFKSKHIITVGLLLLATQYLGLANFKTFPIIISFFLLGSLGKTLYSSSMDSLFLKTTKKEHSKKKISIFLSINYICIGLGIITAGYLLGENIHFEKMFEIIGYTLAVMAIVSLFLLPKSATTTFEILRYKKDILKPDVLFFLFIIFLFSTHYGAEETSYGLFLENVLKLNKFHAGLYMGIAIMSMAISVLVVRRILRKIGIKNALLIGTMMSGLGLILMTIPIPETSFVFRVFHETGDAMVLFTLYYGLLRFFDLERIGGNTGIVTFVIIIGASTSNLLFGIVGAKFGYNVPFLIGGFTSILASMFLLRFRSIIKN